jgi:Protein of unknown function (DUF2730)
VSVGWLDWFRAVYPVFVTLVSLAGLGCVLFLGTKFAAKTTVDGLAKTQAEHETRLQLLEDHSEASPTRQELHDEVAKLAGRMTGVESGMKGIGKQLDTTNNYLHTLIEKSIGGARS